MDWKNKSDYDDCDKLDANGWAFEFLRRNPEYQNEWRDFCKIRDQLVKKHGSADKTNKACYKDDLAWEYFPPKGKDQTFKDWLSKNALKYPKRIWFEQYFAQKWGLKEKFPDPFKNPKPSPAFVKSKGFPRLLDYEDIDTYFYRKDDPFSPIFQKKGKAVLVFDLESPLDPQLKKAKTILRKRAQEEEQEEFIKRLKQKDPKRYSSRLKECLRVYDGKMVNASTSDIAKHIFSDDYPDIPEGAAGSKKVVQTYKLATEYIKGRYLSFL